MTYPKMIPLTLVLVLSTAARGQEVQWRTDVASARQIAHATGRPILIDFSTVNCFWCKKLDQTTFRDPTVARLVSEKLVPLKIDGNHDAALARSFGVHAYPTLIVVSADGKVLNRHEGYLDASRFQTQLLSGIPESPTALAAVAPLHRAAPANLDRPTNPAPQFAFQTKIRLQASEETPAPRIALPSPQELGIAVRSNPTIPQQAPPTGANALFATLRQLGAAGFRWERTSAGYRANIDVPGPANQTTTVEGHGATEEAALANAIANVQSRPQRSAIDSGGIR